MLRNVIITCFILLLSGSGTAHAVSALTFPLERPTSRTISKSNAYLKWIDYLERKKGLVRTRRAVGTLQEQDRTSLRRWDLHNTRSQVTTSARINRQRTYQTPTANRSRFSLHSTLPIAENTQIAYRNGIKYYKGDGVPKNFIYSYMWLSYALSDGHPLARSALLTVQRRMSQTQLLRAKDLRDLLSYQFLSFTDEREVRIRDSVRQNHVDALLNAMVRYARDSRGRYPDDVPRLKPKELCHPESSRCRDYLDFTPMLHTYTLSLPVDPLVSEDRRGSGYAAYIDKDGYLIVQALLSESEIVFAKYRSW